MSLYRNANGAGLPRSPRRHSTDAPGVAQEIARRCGTRVPHLMTVLDALSDSELQVETYAWLKGTVRSTDVLQQRLAALLPDTAMLARTQDVAAWVSRAHGLSLVYWVADHELEITLDEDVDIAIRVIINDVATIEPPVDTAESRDPRASAALRPARDHYGCPVSDPVVTRIVAIEELPLGSPASRRLIAEWSDGTESEAIAWFAEDWLLSEGDLIGLTRTQIRTLAHNRNTQSLRDDQPTLNSRHPFFES